MNRPSGAKSEGGQVLWKDIWKGMSFEVTAVDPKHPHLPALVRQGKIRSLFPEIWSIGNLEILQRPLLGFFCSVKCPGDLILRTYDLVRALRDAGVAVISGFHTPIEKDCLDLLLRGNQPVVICPARGIMKMRLGKSLKENIEEERVLVLSPFEVKVKRPTAEASQLRNRFVGVMAATVFVAYADPRGKTEEFCKVILGSGKPLYTFESHYNKTIVDAGAKPLPVKELAQWAKSLNGIAMDERQDNEQEKNRTR
jgi:predicted Rossmann fold nucleotide-binding protein DprA/Smf involved in DNA uptake